MKVVDVPSKRIKAQGAVALKNLVVLDDPRFLGQRKFNGMKVFLIKRGQKVYIVSGRSWKQSYQHRPFCREAVEAMRQCPYDFEIEAEGCFFLKGTLEEPDPLVTMNCTDETARNYDFRLVLHTLLSANGVDYRSMPYSKSLQALDIGWPKPLILVTSYYGSAKRRAWETERIQGKWEGMMFKRIDGPTYESGKDSANNLKLKQMYLEEHGNHEQDCIVIGLTRSKARKEPQPFGSLLLAQWTSDRRLVYVGKCSGMNDATIQKICDMAKNALERLSQMPQDLQEQLKAAKVSRSDVIGYWRNGPVVQVHYLKQNPSGIYLSLQFDRLRDDKPQEECIRKNY